MSKTVCVVQDFLNDAYKDRIRQAAAAGGFTVQFFTSAEREAAKACIRDCEVLYAQIPDLLRAASPALGWYASSSAGVDAYCADPALFPNPDCLLTSANVYGVTIAEHIVMVALMLLRRLPDYTEPLRRHEWPAPSLIRSIRDGNFTLLGTGNIGQNAAQRLRGMGAAKITGVSRSGKPHPAFDEVYPIARLDEVLGRTEFLISALPGTPDTIGLLDGRRLGLLPWGAYLVNVGRGSVLDQTALRQALDSGALAGAALDVSTPEPLPPADPLWDAKNLILTPHISGNLTLGYTCDENVRLFCENLVRYAKGEPLQGLVDRSRGY